MSKVVRPRLRGSRPGIRRLIAIAALAVVPLVVGKDPTALAQANTASISITKSYVNSAGQAVSAPGGSAAGVSFTFAPSLFGQPSTVLTTNSAGQAFGALSAGSYTFLESTPAPGTTFLSATISQAGGQPQMLNPGAAVPFSPGGSYSVFVTDLLSAQAAAGTASLTIYKLLSSGTGQPAVGPLSGYNFTLAGQNGLPTQTLVTNQLGQASFNSIPAGVYSISEAPTPGASFSSMTINGLAAQQQQAFQIQPGGNYNVEVTNLVGGSGNVSIQIQLVDQSGQPLSGGLLTGYGFALAAQAGSSAPVTVTSSSTGVATANLPPGAYAITEFPLPGASLVGYVINGVPSSSGQFTVGLGQTTNIAVTNRASAASIPAGGGRTVTLATGCNNVVSTFPDGSPSQIIAGGISPTAGVVAIWRFDNGAQIFRAVFFPATASGGQPPIDVSTLNRLDPIFVCVSAPATLTEPSA